MLTYAFRVGIGSGEGKSGKVTVGIGSIGDTAKTVLVVVGPHHERIS